MFRIRFHGRGGHGVKTASRIVGTAAFLGGWQAQDSPVYGAERRGAAIAAFTRIDREPIRERGVVVDPDLVVVADETLLDDPMAGIFAGCESASVVFVNSSRDGVAIARKHQIGCRVLTVDLTGRAIEWLGRGSALSSALGAAAYALTGIGTVELLAEAVRRELAELHIASEAIEKNVALARQVHGGLPAGDFLARQAIAASCLMHVPTYAAGPQGLPIIYAPGNSAARHTGSWRIFRPLIDLDACTRCGICFSYCPDAAIMLDPKGYPAIDYDNCKGCMICYRECPLKCIREEKEVRAW